MVYTLTYRPTTVNLILCTQKDKNTTSEGKTYGKTNDNLVRQFT